MSSPPPLMGLHCSPRPGPRVSPAVGQGCVGPPADTGSGGPPRPSPYRSMKGWAPARTHAGTSVSIRRTLRAVPFLLLLAPDTPQLLLRPPLLVSKIPPIGSARRPWCGPSPRCGCGEGCSRGLTAYQSARWIWGKSRGGKRGASEWGGRGQAKSS